jgi:hypothetical protein
MNSSKRRKAPGLLDLADLPIHSIKKPIYNARTDLIRPHVKLRALMDQEKFGEARLLFTEMVRSSKFNFKHLWRVKLNTLKS